MPDRTAHFEEHRRDLFLLAYRMLGTTSDAEDVVQDTYLRWLGAGEEEIRLPRAYLMTVVSRLALDSLKSARRRREVYTGSWLPEPLVEPVGAGRLEAAESLSIAFLHLLEQLSPAERIAFLLREVFEEPYSAIAGTLETTEDNCRQIVARARRHIREGRARFAINQDRHGQVLGEFLAACASGDPSRLTAILRDDAVLYSDGGGKVRAALNPIFTADHIARFFTGIGRKGGSLQGARVEFVRVNGQTGALILGPEGVQAVLSLEIDEDNRVAAIYLIVNPDKLPGDAPPPAQA